MSFEATSEEPTSTLCPVPTCPQQQTIDVRVACPFVGCEPGAAYCLGRIGKTGCRHRLMRPATSETRLILSLGDKVMFFNGVVHPEQLAMMTAVLNDYCREHGIKNGSEACESTAVMIVALFRDGYQTAGELKGAL